MPRIITYDCGYAVALLAGKKLFRFRLPFPLTLHSWKYLWKNRGRK